MDLTTILVIIFASLLFVVLLLIYGAVFRPAKKEKEAKQKAKEDNSNDKPASNEDIPEILSEVTRNNYMRDRAIQQTKSSELTVDDFKETQEQLDKPNKKYHRIQPIKEDSDQDLNTDDILDSMDSADGKHKQSSIVQEFKGMSKQMKAIVVADALKRKDE